MCLHGLFVNGLDISMLKSLEFKIAGVVDGVALVDAEEEAAHRQAKSQSSQEGPLEAVIVNTDQDQFYADITKAENLQDEDWALRIFS